MGKTTLAYSILVALGSINSHISHPDNGFYFDTSKRFHFLDEAHMIPSPESFYGYMDSGKYTIIIATNEPGDLKEPMYNRCIPLVFEPYTDQELFLIGKGQLHQYPSVPDEVVWCLVRKFKVPRVLKQTIERLKSIFPSFIPRNEEELNSILEEILNIDRDGLNPYERLYMRTLKDLGGQASLNLLVNATRMGKNTILRDIEPSLIYRKFIRLSSKGRILC
jgi:Holliday junction resolvasome RuvABC ATP-dependent DNA helicase subunit